MRKRRDVEAGGGKSPPAAQLIADLQQATPRAKLSNDQNDKLQADVSSLKQAMQAKRQGETVDQDQLKATIDGLHGIADSGTFQEADRNNLTWISRLFNPSEPDCLQT